MEPGKEFDALVAEKVMGKDLMIWSREKPVGPWAKWHDDPDHPYSQWSRWSVEQWGYPTADDCRGRLEIFQVGGGHPDRYSTDIAAAWPVLEKMRALLPGQEIMLYYCNGWSVGSLCQAPSTIEIGDWFSSIHSVPTAPHAICLAALEALAGKPVVPLD